LIIGVMFKLLQVIASRTFSVFFLRLDTKHYVKWIVLISQWSLIGAIVIGGPATVRTDEHGPYYGIVGDWCWIAANYTFQRIILDYMVAFMSALSAFILDAFVFLKLRGIVRERASSTSMTLVDQDRNEKYEHRLARQMLLFPACVQFNNLSKMTDAMTSPSVSVFSVTSSTF